MTPDTLAYIPPPKDLDKDKFPNTRRVRSKSGRARWTDGTNIFEWDSLHGRVEKYDKRGRHQGEYDLDGAQTKDANPNYRIVPFIIGLEGSTRRLALRVSGVEELERYVLEGDRELGVVSARELDASALAKDGRLVVGLRFSRPLQLFLEPVGIDVTELDSRVP